MDWIIDYAERYKFLRERMAMEDMPPEHPDWSAPSEEESRKVDNEIDKRIGSGVNSCALSCVYRYFYQLLQTIDDNGEVQNQEPEYDRARDALHELERIVKKLSGEARRGARD